MALAVMALTASAAPRTAAQALQIAKSFVASAPLFRSVRSASLTLATKATASESRSVSPITPTYYVCNVGDKGFVIVSGDDRFNDILGYSDNGAIADMNDLPDGLQYWLSFLSDEMTSAINAGYEPSQAMERTVINPSKSVAPLVKTKWNQNAPYNNKLNGNMTGCVATGIAQVMKYWGYPQNGKGSHTGAYAPNFSADFSATTYDWANMLDVYGTGWESKAETDAVSTLMLHVGVATDMQWGKSQSATPNAYGAFALHNFFSYNPNLYIETRDHMSLGAWKALLIDQLQSGHPLCYSGMSTETGGVGHFFVCDGYDATNGKFHFNWGWSGMYDGYYDVTALKPGTGGAGAGAGEYNYWQSIFVNVQPTAVGEYKANFNAVEVEMKNSSNKSDVKIIPSGISNDNTYDFKGSIGLAIYNADGSLNTYEASGSTFPMAGFHIGANYTGSWIYSVDLSKIADGTYTVCSAVWSDRDKKVFPLRAKYINTTYYTMKVSGSNVTFTPQALSVNLSSSSVTIGNGSSTDLFKDVPATFKVTITNNSAMDFNDEIGVRIYKGRSAKQHIMVPASIAAGETKVIEVCGAPTLDIADDYSLSACYGINGDYFTVEGSETYTVNIKEGVLLGDANSDGVVTVTDIVETANYILSGKSSPYFNKTAADSNQDGTISVTDIVTDAQIILNK